MSNTTATPTLTSTTAPGKTFASRGELAQHYKSDWHKYNLKRREAGLPLLKEEDFQARLEAALALRRERETKQERSGTDHLKKTKNQKGKTKGNKVGGAVAVSQASAYDKIKEANDEQTKEGGVEVAQDGIEEAAAATPMESEDTTTPTQQQEDPVIDPRQCLFDKHTSATLDANIHRMQRKYGFFIPDQEYLVDKEGLLGYCQEKIKLGHYCLYCQRVFKTWQACQKHMVDTRHTKLRYERGIDMEEFDPFYDWTEADAAFMGKPNKAAPMANASAAGAATTDEMVIVEEGDDNDDEWEDVSDDDEEMGDEDEAQEEDGDEDGGLYAGYTDEIAKYGFDVTPLGELVMPDGRIIGHRGLRRYYKQRIVPANEGTAVVAARNAAGERLYKGRVYNVKSGAAANESQSALALARAGITGGDALPSRNNGILVKSASGGFSAVSLYRFKAVVKKARRDEARGQRLQQRTTQPINRMDKKANRMVTGVSVAHALR